MKLRIAAWVDFIWLLLSVHFFANMKENLWKPSVVIKTQKVFSFSSLGYCKKNMAASWIGPAPDINKQYLNIKSPFSGKQNNNSYNSDETSLGLFYIQFLP